MATFIPFSKDDKRGSALRKFASDENVLGAEATNFDEFIANAPTELRNEAIRKAAGIPSSISGGFGLGRSTGAIDLNDAQVRLSPQELEKQLTDRLRKAGPSTFRSLKEAFGIEDEKAQTKASQQNDITVSDTQGADVTGFRKSFGKSLKPETTEQTMRRRAIGKRKRDELQEAIESQLDENVLASMPKEPGLFERATSAIQGIGANFLDNLFGPQQEAPAIPLPTTINIPETGETLDFAQESFLGNVDPRVRQLEDDAMVAISQGADPAMVKQRLAQMITQLQRSGGKI